MKKIIIITAMFLMYFVSTAEAKYRYNYHYFRHHNYIDINFFFGALEPYGEWIEIGYDEYVWRPYDVGYSWKPYSEGRWEYTRYGWYWVSYEPFGWATYHYGRWFYDDYYGWVWMPGRKWAPAWVEWRYNDYYIGWAPLPPYAEFRPKYGIRFSVRWNAGYNYWNFVSYRNFYTVNVHNYFVDNSRVRNIYHRTKHRTNYFVNNNRIINGGVNRKFIEKRSGVRIRTKEVYRTNSRRELTKLAKNRREVVTYRPGKRELKKFRRFDKSKIRKSRRELKLRRDKVTLGKSREINKTNRLKIKTRRSELRKRYENKNYKPLVRKSERARNKTYKRKEILNNDKGNKQKRMLKKSFPLRKEKSIERKIVKRKRLNINKNKRKTSERSTVRKNNVKKREMPGKPQNTSEKRTGKERRKVTKRR